MAQVLTNFLQYFFPDLASVPAPLQVIVGTVLIGLFFGLILRIVQIFSRHG